MLCIHAYLCLRIFPAYDPYFLETLESFVKLNRETDSRSLFIRIANRLEGLQIVGGVCVAQISKSLDIIWVVVSELQNQTIEDLGLSIERVKRLKFI